MKQELQSFVGFLPICLIENSLSQLMVRTPMESLKYSLFNIKFTAIIKKSSNQVFVPRFLHFFIYITPAEDIFSISSFFKHSTTNQSHAFHISQFTSGSIIFIHLTRMTMKNMLLNKFVFLILVAAKIVHSKDNKIA